MLAGGNAAKVDGKIRQNRNKLSRVTVSTDSFQVQLGNIIQLQHSQKCSQSSIPPYSSLSPTVRVKSTIFQVSFLYILMYSMYYQKLSVAYLIWRRWHMHAYNLCKRVNKAYNFKCFKLYFSVILKLKFPFSL